MASAEPAQLTDILAALRRRRGLIAIFALVGLALGALAWVLLPQTYTASVRVAVNPINTAVLTTASDLQRSVNMATESQVMTSTTVASLAAEEMTPDVGVSDVRAATTVEVPTDSLVLGVSYTAGSPAEAAEGVEAVAQAYLANRQSTAEAQVKRLRLAITRQVVALEESASRPGNDSEIAQRSLSIQADTLGTRAAELSNLDLEPGAVLGAASLPTEPSSLGLLPLALAGLAFGALLAVPVALTRRDRVSRAIGDVEGLDAAGESMVLDGTKDADWEETWDIAAFMLKIPQTLPRESAFVVVVDAASSHGFPAGECLVAALGRRGHTARLVDAGTISDNKIGRGWPSESKRGSWAGEIVVIDSTNVDSDALKVTLADDADQVVLSRTTNDDAPTLARLQSLLRSKGVTVDLTVLFPARAEFVSLTP